MFALLCVLSRSTFCQIDVLHGDNLDFSHGFEGWTAVIGHYITDDNGIGYDFYSTVDSLRFFDDPNDVSDSCDLKMFNIMTDTQATDTNTIGGLRKIPQGYSNSVKIRNECYLSKKWSGLEYTLDLGEDNCLLTLNYALVMQNPLGMPNYRCSTFQVDIVAHDPETQEMTDELIEPCALFEERGRSYGLDGYYPYWHYHTQMQPPIRWCSWQNVRFNLARYIGQRVTIRLRFSPIYGTVSDAPFRWNYCYFTAKTEKPELTLAACEGGGDTVTVACAPDEFAEYKWFEIPEDIALENDQDRIAALDVYRRTLCSTKDFAISETIMGGETEKYFAVRLTSQTTPTSPPPCVYYMVVRVVDMRPTFAMQVHEPDPEDPVGQAMFFIDDVTPAGAPIYWQMYDFGDGTTTVELERSDNRWSVLNPESNPSTTYSYDAAGSVETIKHTYADHGTYTYTRTVRCAEHPEEDEDFYCERAQSKEVNIPRVPSLVLTAEETVCIGGTAHINASSPDREDFRAQLTYRWWRSLEAVDEEEPFFIGTQYEEVITESTTYFVKVTDERTGYGNLREITVDVRTMPAYLLEGNTEICEGNRTYIKAYDPTGEAIAFEWAFHRPYLPYRMSTESAVVVLDFFPNSDTTVYLLARTASGCIAYDSVRISVINSLAFSDKREICPGDTVKLWGENAELYSWSADPRDETLLVERTIEPINVMPQRTTIYTMTAYGASGCQTQRQLTVKVYPYPEARITFSPEFVDVEYPFLYISDKSPHSAFSFWRMSDGGTSNERSLSYSFNDLSGDSVSIHLMTYNRLGCADSISVNVPVELFGVWMPDAFTPNNDGYNDKIFFISSNNLEDVHFEVFNRAGSKVFQLHEAYLSCGMIPDPAELLGWDGTFKGVACPQGTYPYRLQFRRAGSAKVYDRTGTITLIR